MDLPAGTLTFLFTDVEGSTARWEKFPEEMRDAMARHDRIVEERVSLSGGTVVRPRGEGDSRFAVFAGPRSAVAAARDVQEALARESWPTPSPIRVRIALHTGEADLRAGDYYGSAVNRCARLRSLAAGGQTLLSQGCYDLVQDELPERVKLRDLGEHRLKDLGRPEHVYQVDVTGLPAEFPPLKSLDTLPNNLPLQLTRFVGRERELKEVGRLIAQTRLLTLTGSGGTGKTRLALQAAGELLDSFPDGAWFVELAPISDPRLVPQAAASVLGVQEEPGRSLLDSLAGHIRSKKLLLVLDNCEHLLAASAEFADSLLHRCQNVRILASSREALGISGEAAWPVPSLALPESDADSPERLAHSEAVALFVDRGRAVRPDFEITRANAAAVARLCRRLDGIPLAIELAATRLRALSVEQIAARLDDRFRLLTGGSRTALPRQQTLRALIDWSYQLLSAQERLLFRRLSVFVGGWTLEAAQAVCGSDQPGAEDDPLDEFEVLDLMTHLIDKSMVVARAEQARDGDDGLMRYQMLETIRQYAREKLLESGEGEALRDAHLRYFTLFAEQIGGDLRPTQESKLRLHAREEDNLRASMEWALGRDTESAFRILAALGFDWSWETSASEAKRWAQMALERDTRERADDPATPPRIRERGLVTRGYGQLSMALGDNLGARDAFLSSIELLKQTDDVAHLALAYGFLGLIQMFLGDSQAIQTVEKGLALARNAGAPFVLAFDLGLAGQILAGSGETSKRANDLLDESIRLMHELGAMPPALSIMTQGQVAFARGDLTDARDKFEEAMRAARQEGKRRVVTIVQSGLADVERLLGHYSEAKALYRDTLKSWSEFQNRGAVARCMECLAFIAARQGEANGERLREAATLFGAAEKIRETSSDMTTRERDEYESELAALRERLDSAALEACWSKGDAMTDEAAIAFALGDGIQT